MSNYKLIALEKIDLSYRELCKSLNAKELTGVAEAFVGNLDRVVSMASFPGRLDALLSPMKEAYKAVWQKVNSQPSHKDGIPIVYIIDTDLRKLREELGPCEPFTPEQLDTIDRATENGRTIIEVGLDALDEAARMSGDYIGKAVEAMLSSMVVGTWTAFETMTGDLWVKAVNSQPTYLAALTGTESRIRRLVRDKPQAGQKSGKEKEKSQPASDDDACEPLSKTAVTLGAMCKITEGKYDLGDKMGALLLEAKRVQFTSLEGVREAYSLAFSEKVSRARTHGIDAALADKSLDALSAVRNLIVHKAGIADAMYMDDRKIAPTAPPLQEKEVIRLDGEMCRTLIDPVISSSVNLVKAVDLWLTLTRR